ncbi:MAG: hypothetical protein V1861_06510 [Candidatus Micrarchaeota archaeon]
MNDKKGHNAAAVSKSDGRKPYVPDSIALSPPLARRFANRPWTREELGGKESVFDSYARSEREPFRNREQAHA